MNGWRRASLLGGMLAGLVVASGGCSVATSETADERWEAVAEELAEVDAPDESAADEGDDGAGDALDVPTIGEPVDPIPWTNALPGSERLQQVTAPDPVPWQPNTAGCSDPDR
ncbi:hypothetical protein [Polyangium aurulentum]|uniref:hypothetical protein n=1 Tax=Polyangium aurulentum TaxID=2567896 RepID=UPI0010AEA117|nr:hypothetical protein [Polyangium aurulentum]UQA54962.1 hypothetical protein E8A73_026770 [Polyangium aurulentum]